MTPKGVEHWPSYVDTGDAYRVQMSGDAESVEHTTTRRRQDGVAGCRMSVTPKGVEAHADRKTTIAMVIEGADVSDAERR